jgi:hypothetical protein
LKGTIDGRLVTIKRFREAVFKFIYMEIPQAPQKPPTGQSEDVRVVYEAILIDKSTSMKRSDRFISIFGESRFTKAINALMEILEKRYFTYII